ncbi:MAG TPA: hypothetical protein VLZ89_01670 [Anaerolineales bacterium]|nr:hypothetical protein [Anaerolineales bacterium]
MRQLQRFFEIPQAPHNWFGSVILFPFLITRAIWILVAYFVSGNYLSNPTYLNYFKRGYFLTRVFPLDIFTRWDSKWYFSILKTGYQAPVNLSAMYSNLAFFPLYPYLVKSVGWLGVKLPDGFYILFGLLLSNLFFLASAALLYRLAISSFGGDGDAAGRTLTLLVVFPVSFFFSAFYPESLFLFLTVLGFTLALEEKWFWTGVCAALLIVTKPTGIIPVFALAWLYLEKKQWKLQNIRPSILWFLLAPIALFMHFYDLYRVSGQPLAFLDAMTAWGGIQPAAYLNPFQNLLGRELDVFKIDLALTILFLICGLYILGKWKIKAYGVYAVLMILLALSTGLLVSISRYLLVSFPVFILLGQKLKRREWFDLAAAVFFALQVIYFAGWVNYYWIA